MRSKTVTDASFTSDVIDAPGAVLVDFWADWCAPCRMIAPALEEISSELAGTLTVAKVNVDDNPEAAARYGIKSIPALVLFKDGQPAASRLGAAQKRVLRDWIDASL